MVTCENPVYLKARNRWNIALYMARCNHVLAHVRLHAGEILIGAQFNAFDLHLWVFLWSQLLQMYLNIDAVTIFN